MQFATVPEHIMGLTTLADLPDMAAGRYADRPALSLREGHSYSYREIGEAAAAVRQMLAARGIASGDRVVLLADNRPEWGIVYLAATSMGAVIVPILPDFAEAEIGKIVAHCGARMMILSRSLKEKASAALPANHAGGSDWLGELVLEDLPLQADSGSGSQTEPINDSGAGHPRTGHRPAPADLAALLYTSGTTGEPKGVMLTHGNIVANVKSSRTVATITPEDRFLSVLPLAHSYECTIGFLLPFSSGASITYLGRPPALSALLPALQDVRPTMMLSVPLIMEKLYQSRVRPVFRKNILMRIIQRLGPLRRIIHRAAGKKVYETFGGALRFFGIGGAPLSPPAERFLREGKFPYAIGYGLTETAPLVAGTDAEHTRYRSTGPAIEGVEVRIEPEAEDTEQGELLVRGPNVMQGYYHNQEATQEVLSSDGWFRTGDLASRDRDGYLFIKGRLKNMIVGPSGENIYPGDIETVINEHELVVDSIVFSWKEQLVARVHVDVEALEQSMGDPETVTPGSMQQRADAILEEIRKTVNSRVSRHARISRMILQWEPFEMTPTRKIKRFLYTQLGRHEE